MTEVLNSLEPGAEDFGGGGAADEDTHERFPKLTKRLPSIVVEPTDGTEVESGELRWPPDEPGSPDGQMGRQTAEAGAAGEEQLDVGEDKDASGAEMQDN
ncbi:Protein LBH [Takifugu flavidus]|uniref:Protein LBH n=1 Tax=Takifugu flavidus TaxID=433684 RepID=A0A5C6P0V3_9TELE|nr:Protein LBH [Takifugu flavidus]